MDQAMAATALQPTQATLVPLPLLLLLLQLATQLLG